MVDDLKFWGGYALLVTVVLAVGWKQPLEYRFMSKKEIAEREAPKHPTPAPAAEPTPSLLDSKRGTSLDQGPYSEKANRRAYRF